MTPVERAYLAGFFDGEGNVGTYLQPGGRNVGAVIQIAQKDPAVLEAIRKSTGLGRLAQFRKTPGSEGWLWRVGAKKDIAAFVDLIEPYAVVKRRELLLIREFCGTPAGDVRRFEIRDALIVRTPRTRRAVDVLT